MSSFLWRRGTVAAICLALMWSVSACGATTTVTASTPGGTTTGGSPAPGTTATTTTPASTPSSAPTTCAALLAGAGTATAGAEFSDVPFPADSISTPIMGFSSGTGQYTISLFSVCSPGTSAAAVKSYYATQLLAEGWAQDPTLPFDGAYQQSCGDPYCWEKGTNPIARRLIGLEQVTDKGNSLVTYQWRLFVPPPAGNCNVADMTTGGLSSGNGGPNDGFQFPPVTTFNDFGGAAGTHGYRMCSAGDAASIAAFMAHAIGNGGWKVLSSTATSVHAQQPTSPPSGFCMTLDVTTGTHGSYTGEWDLALHSPTAACM